MRMALLSIMLLLGISSCVRKFDNVIEFSKYLNDEKNGYCIVKKINGLKYSLIYLPPTYLAMQDTFLQSGLNYDTTYNGYKNNRTFKLKIEEENAKVNTTGRDMNFKDIGNFQEFISRSHTMNFRMDEHIQLYVNDDKVSPVLTSSINTYGISPELSFLVVFTDNRAKNGNNFKDVDAFTVGYNDQIFNNGKLLFSFELSNIDKY